MAAPISRADETKGPGIVLINIVFLVLSAVFVSLRTFTRIKIVSSMGPEDYLLIGALVSSGLQTGFEILEVKYGAGRHDDTLTTQQVSKQLYYLFWSILIYGLALVLVKSSLILQYVRIFVGRGTRMACYIILVFVVLAWLSTLMAVIFSCSPVRSFWDITIEEWRCVDTVALYLAHGGFQIATDFAILLVPIPALKELHLPWRQKVIVMLLFAVGSFACITSIIRLRYIIIAGVSPDSSWASAGAINWSAVEVNSFIVCACLTGLKPLYDYVTPRLLTSIKSNFSGFSTERRKSIGMQPLAEEDRMRTPSKETSEVAVHDTKERLSEEC